MENTIKKVAIHHLERFASVYKVTSGSSNLQITGTVQRIVDELHKLYARRPSKSYGKFDNNSVDYPTSTHVRVYVEEDKDFDVLTASLMETLRKSAQARASSTGGHVFFAHFERDDMQFLLVAIVTDKLGAALAAGGKLEDVTHLDIDGFRFAGRINLTAWASGEERYIGFLRGKGDVAEYFKEFLGCTTDIQARIETTQLVKALKEFSEKQGHSAAERESFLEKAQFICDRDARAQKQVSFPALANELSPDDPEPLSEFLADPERQLSDGFVADRRSLKAFVSLKKKTNDWTVEFDRKSVHNHKVRYDAAARSITLYGVPDDFHHELLEETPDGG